MDFHLVPTDSAAANREIVRILDSRQHTRFDIIVIDGMDRLALTALARERLTEDGAIICDNSEGWNVYEGLRDSGLNRVDFFGYAPGVVLPPCTSVFFGSRSFLFDARIPIADLELE